MILYICTPDYHTFLACKIADLWSRKVRRRREPLFVEHQPESFRKDTAEWNTAFVDI